ncbi:hypothetical protein T439DRAFT_104725 [Meredithblackwellia eburnea MCA 4105]
MNPGSWGSGSTGQGSGGYSNAFLRTSRFRYDPIPPFDYLSPTSTLPSTERTPPTEESKNPPTWPSGLAASAASFTTALDAPHTSFAWLKPQEWSDLSPSSLIMDCRKLVPIGEIPLSEESRREPPVLYKLRITKDDWEELVPFFIPPLNIIPASPLSNSASIPTSLPVSPPLATRFPGPDLSHLPADSTFDTRARHIASQLLALLRKKWDLQFERGTTCEWLDKNMKWWECFFEVRCVRGMEKRRGNWVSAFLEIRDWGKRERRRRDVAVIV